MVKETKTKHGTKVVVAPSCSEPILKSTYILGSFGAIAVVEDLNSKLGLAHHTTYVAEVEIVAREDAREDEESIGSNVYLL